VTDIDIFTQERVALTHHELILFGLTNNYR